MSIIEIKYNRAAHVNRRLSTKKKVFGGWMAQLQHHMTLLRPILDEAPQRNYLKKTGRLCIILSAIGFTKETTQNEMNHKKRG